MRLTDRYLLIEIPQFYHIILSGKFSIRKVSFKAYETSQEWREKAGAGLELMKAHERGSGNGKTEKRDLSVLYKYS